MAASDFWWLQPSIVAIGIGISLTMARATIATNRRIARVKATLDLIETAESSEYYQGLYQAFKRFRADPAFKNIVLSPRTDEDRKSRLQCWDFLNHYELVAIGIAEGILDENFYRRWMGYAVLRDHKEGRDLIEAARAPRNPGDPGDTVAYIELEQLCRKWNARAINV
jgi:hypothetical protein